MNGRANGPLGAVLAAGSAALLAVLAYYEVLTYWFTGTDTIPLIETSRVSSLGEVLGIFAGPLMEGSQFTDRALFYRPIASLSYAIDYALWGLDPFGYHLTDLLAHATAAALVVALVYTVLDDVLTGAIAGWVFAIHPLSVEVVPTPARRHDVLATVFGLIALVLFVRAARATFAASTTDPRSTDPTARTPTSRRRRWLLVCGSVLAYVLAIGAKEIGVLVAVLAGTWVLVNAYGRRLSVRQAVRSGVVLLVPYALATAGYLALRLVVLGGIGGYDRPPGPLSAEAIAVTTSRYVLSLVYPTDFLGALSQVNFQLIPNGLYVVLAGASILAVHNVSRSRGDRSLLASARGRLLALSGVWFVVPVALFVRTGRYTVRSGYVSVVPIAVTLAVVLVASVRTVHRRRQQSDAGSEHVETGTDSRGSSRVRQYRQPRERERTGPGLATLAVACVLLTSLVAGSALVQSYDEWEEAGAVSEDTLEAIAGASETTAANATLNVSTIPHPKSARRMGSFPYPRSVTFVWGNTIESWLRLRGQAGDREVYINDTAVLTDVPPETTASAERVNDSVRITLHYGSRSENAGNGTASSASTASNTGDTGTLGERNDRETDRSLARTVRLAGG